MDDLPATQAMDGYDDVATQKLFDDDEEETLVGTLRIGDKSYSIVSGITTIGRHPDSKIHTNHETVSKHHAEIEATSANNSIFIKDLNSSNRTKLNNSRLKANCLYQIRDGDVLTFGQVVGTFTVYTPLEDSVAPCTPQVKQELKPVIPSTPDSSLDVSYNSEGDVSAIPGTQTDDVDPHFRRPKTPGRASMSNDSMKLNLSNLPSPLSKSQTSQDDLNVADTHRMSSSGLRDDLEEDIFDLETQKPTSHESNDSTENLLEMETQRPSNDIHHVETQRCSSHKSGTERKSETFNVHDGSCLEKCNISSTSHVKTPSRTPAKSNYDEISDLETQSYDHEDSTSNRKSEPGQDGMGEISNVSISLQDESLCNLETQSFGDEKIVSKHETSNESIYYLETQKEVPEELFDEDFNNVETQRFDMKKPTLDSRKSADSSIYDAQTQPNTPLNTVRTTIEARKLDEGSTRNESCQSADVSIYSAETQKITFEASHNAAMSDIETQRFDLEQGEDQGDESFGNLETQAFDTSKSTPASEKSVCESIHDAETQRLSTSATKSTKNSSVRVTDSRRSEIFRTPLPSPALKRSSIKPAHHSESVKRESEIRDGGADQSMDDLETQKFDSEYRESMSTGNVPIGDVSRESLQMSGNELDEVADRLIEDLETPKVRTRESRNSSLAPIERKSSASFAKVADQSQNESHCESIQDFETQKFSNDDFEELFSQSSTPRKSVGPMLRQSDVMTSTSRQTMSQSIQDLETQSFVSDESKEFSRPSTARKSNIESQLRKSVCSGRKSSIKPVSETSKLTDQSIHELEAQKFDGNESRKSAILSSSTRESGLMKVRTTDENAVAQPNEILETRTTNSSNMSSCDVSGRKSSNSPQVSARNTMLTSKFENDECFEDLETQEVDERPLDAVIDETTDDVDSQGIAFSIQDMETMPFMNETLSVDRSIKNQTTRNSILTEQMSNDERIDVPHGKHEQEVHTSVHDKSAQEKNVTLDDDDKDMFCSQNLLEDCPIAYLDDGEEVSTETNVSVKLPNEQKSVDGSALAPESVGNVRGQNDSNKIDRESEDSETDEEGVFSGHLSKDEDGSARQTLNEDAEEISSPVKCGDVSHNNSGKEINTDVSTRKSGVRSELVDDDGSETDEEGIFSHSLSRRENAENTSVNPVVTDDARALVSVNNESDTDEELFEDDSINERNDDASHRISDSAKKSSEPKSSMADSSDRLSSTVDEDDEFIAPTQIVDKRTSQIADSNDMYGAPTQISSRISSDEQSIKESNNIVTRKSQVMDLEECTDTLEPTQIIDKETNTMNGEDVKEASNSSKRSLEELEIGNSKRFRNSGMSPHTKVDLNCTVEKNLDQMFEGPEEKVPENESVLLTQQLANILESSQTESVPQVEQALMSPSPTLGSRRSRARTKSRRTLNEETSSAILNVKPNLNDTVEKNLNEIFQNSVNSIEEYETDGLMTQQLANILSSQDDNQPIDAESSDSHQVPATPPTSTIRKSRSSMASRKSSVVPCQRQSTSRRSALPRSQLDGSKLEASIQENIVAEKTAQNSSVSEPNDEHNVLERSHSDGEILKQSRKSIAYRHATVGFLSDLSPITTSEKVGFAVTEGRAFSSDSQSDGEDLQTVMKKRISLSLSKSVDLNLSMSSLSGKDERIGVTSISQSPKSNTGNTDDQQSGEGNSGRKVMKKRSFARGTRGFSSTHEPVDGSDCVSAYSTESEDNQSPRKKGSEADSARKSSGSASSTMTLKTSGPMNNLNKSSVAPQDDAQNRLSKRTKLTRDDELFKKLSSPASQLQKDKRAVSTPKALANVDATDDTACESNVRGQGRRAARRKIENSDVPSNNSSKENLEVDGSDAVSGAKRTRTQTHKVQKNVKTIKDSKSDEKSPSQDPKKKRGRPRKDQSMMDSSLNSSIVETNTKKAETPSQEAKKKLGRPRKNQISDSPTEQSNVHLDESEKSTQETVKRRGRPRKENSRDVSLDDKNIGNPRSSAKSKLNQAAENRLIQVSRVSCVSGRTRTRGTKRQGDESTTKNSKNDQILTSNQPKKTRNQRQNEEIEKVSVRRNRTIFLDDSDSEAEFAVSKDRKDQNSKEERAIQVENTQTTSNRAKSTKSVEVETFTRSTRGKRGINSNLESNDNQNATVETKNKLIKIMEDSSESQESQESQEMIPKGTRSRPAKSTKSSKSADTARLNSKVTKGKRARPRNQSISSAHSENNDEDSVGQNRTVKEKKLQPTRQTRKRAASPVKLIECSSEESQEVAEIMQKSIEKDNPNSRARVGRVPKKDKEDTVTSVSSTKRHLKEDFDFEKPSSRPKRGKPSDSSEKSLLDQPVMSNKNSESSSSQRPSRRKNIEQPASSSSAVSSKQEQLSDSHKIFYLGKQSKMRQIIKKLGGSETEDSTECTILVSDNVVKTFEFLYSLLRGIPIVSTKWLEDSNKTKSFVDWKDYVLEDRKAESEHGFNLQTSLLKARDHKILDGYTIFLTPTITEPTIHQLKELVTLCGGKPIVKAPTRWSAKTLVIVEVGNSQSVKKHLTKAPKTVKVYSTELILAGILRQNIDLNEYKIIL